MIASMPRTKMSCPSALVVTVACAAALTGCGSDGISIEELPSELERRVCARAVACGGAQSQTACESTLFLADSLDVLTVVEAVKRGTVKYDGDSARICLDAVRTDCVDVVEPDACDDVFQGTVATGGACVTSAECADGGRCSIPNTCGVSCCAGTCQGGSAPAAIGEACRSITSTPCVDGAFCFDGTCTARRPVGAACHGAVDECAEPAVCLSVPGGSETCTVISTEPGAACVPGANFGCGRADETCNATTSRCTKRAAPDGACETDLDCVSYAYCDAAAGTCKARPTLGQPCDGSSAGVFCEGGLICPNGTCVAPAPGTACVP